MQIPDFDKLQQERNRCQQDGGRCRCTRYTSGVHPNPTFYKYYWWVFWNESPVDGREFLSDQYRLSTAAALQLFNSLKERNEPCWLYNDKVPRRGSTIPFDPQKWQVENFAPAYDEDPDPIASGDLSGHR